MRPEMPLQKRRPVKALPAKATVQDIFKTFDFYVRLRKFASLRLGQRQVQGQLHLPRRHRQPQTSVTARQNPKNRPTPHLYLPKSSRRSTVSTRSDPKVFKAFGDK